MITDRLLQKAKEYVDNNYSDAYIESVLWAQRDNNTSIKDIAEAIEKVKQNASDKR